MDTNDDPRAVYAIIGIIIGVVAMAAGPIRNISEWSEQKRREPQINYLSHMNEIIASAHLAGYFPLRGYDFNKDGLLDRVEQYTHGAPRIPWGSWHELESNHSSYQALQQEYARRF